MNYVCPDIHTGNTMSVTAIRDTTESKVANVSDASTKVWKNNSAPDSQNKVTTTDFQLSGSTHSLTMVKFIVNIIPTIPLIQFDHGKETENIHQLLNWSSKNLRNDLQTRKITNTNSRCLTASQPLLNLTMNSLAPWLKQSKHIDETGEQHNTCTRSTREERLTVNAWLTCVTTDLIIALAAIKQSAKLSLWLLLLLLWNSTEWSLTRQQLNRILLYSAQQTLQHTELQQLSAQQHNSQISTIQRLWAHTATARLTTVTQCCIGPNLLASDQKTPCAGSGGIRIGPLHLLAGCRKRLTKPGCVLFVLARAVSNVYFFCVLGVCYALFLCFRFAWKDSSLKWAIMCREGCKTLPYQTKKHFYKVYLYHGTL